MRVSCKHCGLTHEAGTVCSRKPKKNKSYRYGMTEETAELRKFRSGGQWRNMSKMIRERDCNCCRVCLELSNYGTYQGRRIQSRGLSVHHIIPMAEDFELRLDPDNLITLCSYHHEMAEQNGIKREELRALATSDIDFSIPPTY